MKEDKTEQHWDKLLHIRTSGRDDSHSDQYRYPYEPTPYTVLQRLADSGIFESTICCWIMAAERRVDFFLSWQTDVSLSGLNMMSGSMKMHRKIKRQQFLLDGYLLKKWMRQNSLSRIRRTGCIFLIRFL